ncbi:MAG: hypothetical protein LBK95_03720, partial [Bifidobacteriaceae bacterium]|jgi:hypothetical protein|nr:hypothetical protein [Bifidobacteriaceae bacterium]
MTASIIGGLVVLSSVVVLAVGLISSSTHGLSQSPPRTGTAATASAAVVEPASSDGSESSANDQPSEPTASRDADESESPTGSGSAVEGFPITFFAFDNSYVINSISVGVSDDGNTTIKALGSGFDIMVIRDNKLQFPVGCAIMVDGVETDWSSASVDSGEVEWEFETTATPDSVVFYPQDDESDRTERPVK